MADCYIVKSGGNPKKDKKVFEFNISQNLMLNTNVTSNFTIEKSEQKVLITIPANVAAGAWVPLMSATIDLKLNYMYYLCSIDYNGYGRIGICNTTSASGAWPFEQAGRNAFGYFPYELKSTYRDGDNHVIRDDCHEAWFYLPTTNNAAYTKKTVPFALWFCGDKLHNEAREAFTFSIELYEQIKE